MYLAQPGNLRSLFNALNDEVFEIREKAISIIGRLSVCNPAYVLPLIRKLLIQLLTELGKAAINSSLFVSLSLILSTCTHFALSHFAELGCYLLL
jgi:FKBP12-rapamycin complex-associated protein